MAGRLTGKRSVRAAASSGLQEWQRPAVREGGSVQWSARDSGQWSAKAAGHIKAKFLFTGWFGPRHTDREFFQEFRPNIS